MSGKPLVSVVCTAYNHAKFIRDCLDGFIMQKTNFAFEVLINDDASTDNTAEIIREYEIKYPQIIKPIYQVENQYSKRVGLWRTILFPRVQGKYIALCEGDDYWTDPLKLQKQVDFLEENEEFGLVHTNYYIQNERNNTTCVDYFGEINKYNNEEEKYLFDGKMRTLTVLFRAYFIVEINNIMSYPEFQNALAGDRVMFLTISTMSKIKFLEDVTGVYRVSNRDSASNFRNKSDHYHFILQVAKTNLKLINYLDIKNKRYKKFVTNRVNFLECCLLLSHKKHLSAFKKSFTLRIGLNEFKEIIHLLFF